MSSIYEVEELRGITFVPLGRGTGGPYELMPAEPGKRHRIVGGFVSFSADATFDLLSAAGSLFGGAMTMPAKGGFVVPSEGVWNQTDVGEALNLTTTGADARGFLKIRTE